MYIERIAVKLPITLKLFFGLCGVFILIGCGDYGNRYTAGGPDMHDALEEDNLSFADNYDLADLLVAKEQRDLLINILRSHAELTQMVDDVIELKGTGVGDLMDQWDYHYESAKISARVLRKSGDVEFESIHRMHIDVLLGIQDRLNQHSYQGYQGYQGSE